MISSFYGGQPCPPWGSSPISFLQRVRAISIPYKKKNLCFTFGLYRSKNSIISSSRYCCYWLSAKAGALSLPFLTHAMHIQHFWLLFMPTTLDKYYLPHLRACEMLIGSLTAVWMQYRQQQGLGYRQTICGGRRITFRMRTVYLPVYLYGKNCLFSGACRHHSLFGRRRIHLFQSI